RYWRAVARTALQNGAGDGGVLHRIPEKEGAGGEAAMGLHERAEKGVELRAILEGRIDQHAAALLLRREHGLQGGVAVHLMGLHARIAAEIRAQRLRVFRVEFAEGEAVDRSCQMR